MSLIPPDSVCTAFMKHFYQECAAKWGSVYDERYIHLKDGDQSYAMARMTVQGEVCVCSLWADPDYAPIISGICCLRVAAGPGPDLIIKVRIGLQIPTGASVFHVSVGDAVWVEYPTIDGAMEVCALRHLSLVQRKARLRIADDPMGALVCALREDFNSYGFDEDALVVSRNKVELKGEVRGLKEMFVVNMSWRSGVLNGSFGYVKSGSIVKYIQKEDGSWSWDNFFSDKETVSTIEGARAFHTLHLAGLQSASSSK